MKRILLIASALLLTTSLVPDDAEAARRPAVVVVKPVPAKVWVPSATVWDVRLGRYVHIAGHWKTPPRANVQWVPGHWTGRGHAKRWVPGHWSSRR